MADRRAYYRAKSKQYRKDNPEYWNDRIKLCRDWVDAFKAQPCVDCDVTYPPPVMELDHVRGEKLFNVAKMAHAGYSIAAIETELQKCEVRCANCHRLRHVKDGWR